MKRHSLMRVMSGLILCSFLFCGKPSEPLKQITDIDLINHEIVLADSVTGQREQITETGQKVLNIMVSPDSQYIAYEQQWQQIDAAGLFDEGETVPKVPVCGIHVYSMRNRKVIRSFKSESGESPFLKLNGWNSSDELCYVQAGHFDVSSIFIYQISRDEVIDTDYQLHR